MSLQIFCFSTVYFFLKIDLKLLKKEAHEMLSKYGRTDKLKVILRAEERIMMFEIASHFQ